MPCLNYTWCVNLKVQELDVNRDGLNDVLKFELHFFAKFSIHAVRLLLFFNYELKVRNDRLILNE